MDELEPKQRRWWMRAWCAPHVRQLKGAFTQLMDELRVQNIPAFCNFIRIPLHMFDKLLYRVGPRITKKISRWRMLHPLDWSYHSLLYHWRVADTLSKMVMEVVLAIIEEYIREVIQFPRTPAEWKAIAWRFGEKWNFWHALGAMDGKHVGIVKPPHSGSGFHKYKKFFSISWWP